MPYSVTQYLFEFSLLLGLCYGAIYRLPLRAADRNSLLAGLPLLCLLIPGLRFTGLDSMPGIISWVSGEWSVRHADWGFFFRSLSVSALLFFIYWVGVAIGLARLVDRFYRISPQYPAEKRPFRSRVYFPMEEQPHRLTAGLSLLVHSPDRLLLEKSLLKLSSPLYFRHFFEVLLLEGIVLFFWWNPLVWLYRDQYREGLRRQLLDWHAPSGAESPTPGALRQASKRIAVVLAGSIFLVNTQPVLPGGLQYQQFFLKSEQLAGYTFFGENPAFQPEMLMEWGSHEIPLAEVHAEDQLDFAIYYLQPFEFHQLRNSFPRIRVGAGYSELESLYGWIGMPYTDQLSAIGSLDEFQRRLPRLVSVGEQTLYLRLSDKSGRNWVAVLAITEMGLTYGQEAGISHVAREVASINQVEQPGRVSFSPYRLQWGALDIRLEKYASPDVYRGFAEVSIDSLLPQLRQPMTYLAGDSLLQIEELSIRAFGSPAWESIAWGPSIEWEGSVPANDPLLEHLIANLAPGHEISIYGKVGGIHLNTILIRVHDPNQLYRPKLRAPDINRNPADDRFQLINRPGYPSMVRLDTMDPQNLRILEIYRSKPDYQIIHVPGFRTNERLVNVWQSSLDYIESEDFITAEDLAYHVRYPEFHAYHDQLVQLNWGSMWAMPNSEVYSPDEYEINRREGFILRIGGEVQKIVKATVVFARDGLVTGVYFLDPVDLSRPHILPKAQAETSVFFSNFILEDTSGQQSVLPVTFAFHIGKETGPEEWAVEIEPDSPGTPIVERTEEVIRYEHYRLSDLIPELLEVRKSRLSFENLKEDDPRVQLTFKGKEYRDQQARELMLRSLQKEYNFVVEHHRIPADVRRLQVNVEDRLLEHRNTGDPVPAEDRVYVSEGDGSRHLKDYTLIDLAAWLEEVYNLPVELYPTPYNFLTFNFSLKKGSLEDVERQLLQDYGIKVFSDNWLYNGLKVIFGEDSGELEHTSS